MLLATHRADEVRQPLPLQGLLRAVREGMHAADAAPLDVGAFHLGPQSCRRAQRRPAELLVHRQLLKRRQLRTQPPPLLRHAGLQVHGAQIAVLLEVLVDPAGLFLVRQRRRRRRERDPAVLHLPVPAVDLPSGLLVEVLCHLLGLGTLELFCCAVSRTCLAGAVPAVSHILSLPVDEGLERQPLLAPPAHVHDVLNTVRSPT